MYKYIHKIALKKQLIITHDYDIYMLQLYKCNSPGKSVEN